MSADHYPSANPETVMNDIRERGFKPYFIPAGASDHPLGGLGFARWAFEVVEQERELNTFFDTVVVAVASGSTLGGMVAGFKLADQNDATTVTGYRRRRTLIGIEAYTIPKHDIVKNVLRIAKATAVHLGLKGSNITEKDFMVDDRFTGPAYGELDLSTKKTINEMAATEGILLDPVYSGKAATGMLDIARNDENFQRSNILFCHTGGQISLSAYAQEI
jgi:1-aminocyclopropane-1-carboxylate deaminase